MSIFSRVIAGYMKMSKCYPYTVQMVQTGLLMAGGDVIAQQFIEKTDKHDWLRTKQFAVLGVLFVAPVTTTWYRYLDKIYRPHNVSTSNLRAMRIIGLKKMCTDQIIFAPLFLASLLLIIGRLKCKKWEQNVDDVRAQYKDVILANYTVWPFVQLVNFTFVPVHMQVLLVQIAALFWNTFISWRTAKTIDDTPPKTSKKD
ncbi:protein Mpv17-like [Chrysoperla carnea]|uniref:protein Mpv17-like n=1 Tax=Chrysoperla carnea TaxID=189513 RepID=UPI001D066596|nr:protein Mpv17-like [Chrysoperla carnea]